MMKNIMISKELLKRLLNVPEELIERVPEERLSSKELLKRLLSDSVPEELEELSLELKRILCLIDKRVLEDLELLDTSLKTEVIKELIENNQNRCFDCGFKIEDHQQVCDFCISNYN